MYLIRCSICYTNQKCTVCGDETEKVVLPLLNHTYGEANVTSIPTSDIKGSATITCSVCEDVVTIELPLLTSTSYTVVTSDEDENLSMFENEKF